MPANYGIDCNAWQNFYKVIGLPSRPLLPFYFDTCPYCNKGPVRCAADNTYTDGWCGCESCYTGKPIIQFLSDLLNITPQEISTHYTNKRYKENILHALDVWRQYKKNWNKYELIPPNITEAFDIPQSFRFPRITNQNWQQRATGYVYVLDNMIGKAQRIFNVRSWTFCFLWPHPKPWIAVKCYDVIGRPSGFIVCSEDHDHKPLVLLPNVDRRGSSRTEIGFGFGQALWSESVFKQQLGSTYFVVPADVAASWQLEYLRDHTRLLPVLSYVFGPPVTSGDRFKNRRFGAWGYWTDKQFVIWARELTDNVKRIITMYDCLFYIGDLPEEVHAYDTHLAKLKYILHHSKLHKEER